MAGERTAQRQLYERYSPTLFALCFRYMRNRAEAEDVMIMGFTTIFEKMNTFREEGSFEGWMKKVMIHTAISVIRANEMSYLLESDESILNDAGIGMTQNLTYSKINVKDIMKQIQQLPDGCRTIFNLCAIEGYSYDKAANSLNINVGTVRSQLARARKILQKRLIDYI